MTDNKRKDSPLLRWGRAKVVELFGADLRSLAAFRIVLALLVLADLAGRATDLYAHYTDRGVLPRSVLVEELLTPWEFSLNLMNGELFFQALLFAVAALAALALLVGYRTRLVIVVVWILVLSIQLRNPLVLNIGDALLHLLLFWGMFLPLGAYWSIDRARMTAPPRLSMRFLSVATFALFAQIAFVYWFSVALKSGPEWRVDGTALYYALSIDEIATPIGAYLLDFPELLKVLTFAAFWFEAVGPLLLFFPVLTGPVRTAAVLAFMGFHFGIWLMLDIGIFPWVAAFCMVCFLPSWFWEKTLPEVSGAFAKQPEIVRRPLLLLWSRFSAVAGLGEPSAANEGAAEQEVEHSTAAAAGSSNPAALVAARLREAGFDARSRTAPSTPPARTNVAPTMLRSSVVINLLAVFFLLYVFFWNLTTVSTFTMPASAIPPGSFLGLGQGWGMFAPYPNKEGGWYVIPGNLRSGQQVDLMAVTRDDFSLHEMSWEKPRNVVGTYKNNHWRKYLEIIRAEEYANQHLYFGSYICREWNARHADTNQLTDFQITYMLQTTLPDYQSTTPEGVVLWEQNCFT